jgi:glutathione synthase
MWLYESSCMWLAGEELVAKLKEGGRQLASYILMHRIKPARNTSVLVRQGRHSTEETLSELGIYGVFLRVQEDTVENRCVGHLLRTKTATSNEGGVAAGFAVLDSPYLS